MSANIGFLAVLEIDNTECCARLRCPSCDGSGGWVEFAQSTFPYDYYVDHGDGCQRFEENP